MQTPPTQEIGVYSSRETEKIKEVGTLKFPENIKFATWKIGAGAPPFWISENIALMIFHGIEIKDEKKVYSLGRNFLHRGGNQKFTLGTVDNSPILQFSDLCVDCRQLHDEREVVYTCGSEVYDCEDEDNPFCGKKVMSLYVNFGDWKTFKVTYSLEELLDFSKKPSFIIEEIDGLEHQINTGVWRTSENDTVLLSRYVPEASPEGEPDRGYLLKKKISKKLNELVESRIQNNVIVDDRVVWSPEGKDVLLEDTRCLVLEDGSVSIGLTKVIPETLNSEDWIKVPKSITILENKKNRTTAEENELKTLREIVIKGVMPVAYPATTSLASKDDFGEVIRDEDIKIHKEFGRGKNMTPVDSKYFFFRKEGENQELTILEVESDDEHELPFAA